VISEGVKAGDQVVVDGQLRLAPGMKVTIRSTRATQPQAAAADEAPMQPAGD
jgi:multidrug efflux pump subunit AcrA (membrane-fusion protein)